MEKEGKKCALCKAPFLNHEHRHATRNGEYHTSCYGKITGKASSPLPRNEVHFEGCSANRGKQCDCPMYPNKQAKDFSETEGYRNAVREAAVLGAEDQDSQKEGLISGADEKVPANPSETGVSPEWEDRFREKKQELKDWLYGTIYKGYDQEETADTVQQDVDYFFTTEWMKELIASEIELAEERLVNELKEMIIKEKNSGPTSERFKDLCTAMLGKVESIVSIAKGEGK